MNPLIEILIKRSTSYGGGFFGVIHNEKEPFALTAEREWQNNQADISCIPKGEYLCKRVQSPKFGETFEIQNVKDRKNILFHSGNVPEQDSHGCILIGESFGKIGDETAILSSKAGFQEFMGILKGQNEFKLVIEEPLGWTT